MSNREQIEDQDMEPMSFFDDLVLSQYTQEDYFEEKIVPRKYTEARKARADKLYKIMVLFY